MNRMLLGALGALMLTAIGMFWWQGRAIEAPGLPPPEPFVEETTSAPEALPTADVADVRGPKLPEAIEMSKEQKRFARYDRNNDILITRTEMLSTRTNAFRKLDLDGNNLLTFEEWAVATVNKFDGADANRNGQLTPAEFASTRRPTTPRKPRCAC